METQVAKCDIPETDAEHPLGLSSTFKTMAREKASTLQQVITKAKAHVRRVRLSRASEPDAAITAILDDEEVLIGHAEARKKLFLSLTKGSESDLPDLFHDVVVTGQQVQLTSNHTLLSQIWSVELNQLVRNSQMQGLQEQLCHTSERAAAIQAAHDEDASRPPADDMAIYIMEDPAHKCGCRV